MKPILLGVPVYREDPSLLRDAIRSMIDPLTDVFVIDNGGACLDVIDEFKGEIEVVHYIENIYVNPAWNLIAWEFLRSSSFVLAIANADAILSPGWGKKLLQASMRQGEYWRGNGVRERLELFDSDPLPPEAHSAGVFFAMARRDVARVFPIPEELRIWYGDTWIWTTLKRLGRREATVDGIRVWHAGSVSSSRLPEFHEIVCQDQMLWQTRFERECRERVIESSNERRS